MSRARFRSTFTLKKPTESLLSGRKGIKKKFRPGFIALPLLALAPVAMASGFTCNSPMIAHDNPNVMKGDFSPSVKFDAVKIQPTMVGFGATTGRSQEITLVDGKLFLVKSEGESLKTRHKADKGEGAVVLVAGAPAAWKAFGKADGVGSFAGLNFLLDAVDDVKCDDSARVPFKTTTHANSVTWSVVDGSGKDKIVTSKGVGVTVVGIYSKTDKESLHMVKGYNIHAHVVIPGQDAAGHSVPPSCRSS